MAEFLATSLTGWISSEVRLRVFFAASRPVVDKAVPPPAMEGETEAVVAPAPPALFSVSSPPTTTEVGTDVELSSELFAAGVGVATGGATGGGVAVVAAVVLVEEGGSNLNLGSWRKATHAP